MPVHNFYDDLYDIYMITRLRITFWAILWASLVKAMCLFLQNGFTALHLAAKKNWLDMADLLLNNAADPNSQSVVSARYRGHN